MNKNVEKFIIWIYFVVLNLVIVVFQCHHMSVVDFMVSLVVVAEV
jgi:hypothetical protein